MAAALALAAGPDAAPRLVVAEGVVEIGAGEPPVWRPAGAGDRVRPGESVRVGPGSRAELDIGKGRVRLYESSVLRLPAATGTRAVELDEGSSLFDIDPAANRDGFEVRTPEAVVMVKGTRFAVALDGGAAAVSVFRGLVAVRELADTLEQEVLVRRGFTAVLGPELPLELRLDDLPDPWEGWSSGERLRQVGELASQATPAKIASDEARAAAQRAARIETLGNLARRNPALARRIQAAYAAKLAEQAALEAGADGPDGVEGGVTDPLTQVPDDSNDSLDESLAGEVLNTSSGIGSLPLDVKWVEQLDSLIFLDSTGQIVARLSEADIDRYEQTLDPTQIPQPVLFQIQASGLSPDQYLSLLDDMFFD